MKFQNNQNIQFEDRPELVAKAEALKPQLHEKIIKPTRLVTIQPDTDNLFGYSAQDSEQALSALATYRYGKGDQVTFDFGDHQVGHFSIGIDAVGSPMDAPLYLHLVFAELPVEIGVNGQPFKGALSRSWIAEEYVHLDNLPATLTLPRRYACRYVHLSVIDTSPKWQVRFHNPLFRAQSAVVDDEVPALKTEDPLLKRIDQVSIKTLHDCMQDVFEDGPKRDQRLWLGDLRLQALANYATFDNQNLVKRCLYLFGGSMTTDHRITANVFTRREPIPDDTFLFDYSLFFVNTLADYVAHYHDEAILTDLLPIAQAQIDRALRLVDEQGLIQLVDEWPVFVDWAQDFDKTTCAQAIMIYALRGFLSLQRQPDARYVAKLAQLVASAKTYLYDDARGMFISGDNGEINLASQVWMVLAGVMTGDDAHRLMTASIHQFFPVRGIATPYFYHHIVEAMFVSGHAPEAVSLMKDYWGAMIDAGADTFWEAFMPEQPDFSPYGDQALNSYCHAWSCTPAYLLRKYESDLD